MRATIIAVIVLSCLFALPPPAGAASSDGPSINWTAATGYPAAMAGSGWSSKARVAVWISQNNRVFGLEVRATPAGTFEIGLKRFQCSYGGVIMASDLNGNRATGPVLDPCGRQKPYTPPQLVVLKGKRQHVKVTHDSGIGSPKPTKIHLGDALYLWERGVKAPDYKPTAPQAYFGPIGEGRANKPGCSGANCKPGFFWKWIGLKTGKSDIELQPWCGSHACPEDYIIALQVDILPSTSS